MRYLLTLWRFGLLTSQPIPALTNYSPLIQPFAAVVVFLGLSFLAPYGLVFVLGLVIILVAIAGLKLQAKKDERLRRKQLRGMGTDEDRNARRLIVLNPNEFPAVHAFVELRAVRVVDASLEEGQ